MPESKVDWKVLVASTNQGKIREFQDLLEPLGVAVVSPRSVGGLDPVEEDGLTLEANARRKAGAAFRQSGLWSLADDSGLFVEALDGAPGLISARYAGPEQDAAANRAKVLSRLRGVEDRRAWFRCVLALAGPQERMEVFTGECAGRIASGEHGRGGFGYDSIFVPEGHDRTFAEMDPEEKHALSHRGRALQQLNVFFHGRLSALEP